MIISVGKYSKRHINDANVPSLDFFPSGSIEYDFENEFPWGRPIKLQKVWMRMQDNRLPALFKNRWFVNDPNSHVYVICRSVTNTMLIKFIIPSVYCS